MSLEPTHYVTVPGGQLRVQIGGQGPTLLVLPEPGFDADPDWLRTPLVEQFTLLLVDQITPEDPCGGEVDQVRGLAHWVDAWSINSAHLLVPPGSEDLATGLQTALPDVITGGLRLPGPGLAPWLAGVDLTPRDDGTHWLSAWHLLRNAEMFTRPDGQRFAGLGHPDLERLTRRCRELLRPGSAQAAATARPSTSWPVLDLSKPAPATPIALAEHVATALNHRRHDPDTGEPPKPTEWHEELAHALARPGGVRRAMLPTAHGWVRLRIEGASGAPALLFLHGSPGSADSFGPTLQALAADYLVLAPDCPGNGGSTPHPDERASLPQLAASLAEAMAPLTESGLLIEATYGIHTGAGLAVEMALIDARLTGTVVANGLTRFDPAERADLEANYFLDTSPARHGTHLVSAWHLMRDVTLFWPWYANDPHAARPTSPPPPAVLHRLVSEFVLSGPSYAVSYRAAFNHDAVSGFQQLGAVAVACATATDPLRPATRDACAQSGQRFYDLASPAPADVRALLRAALGTSP